MELQHFFPLTALIVAAPTLAAEEEDAGGPWSGKATLGYLATSGNTENTNLNTGFEIGYTVDGWEHRATAKAINATENEATTAEAYELGWRTVRNLSEFNYIFGRLNWRKDRFSGYDTQFSQSVGYGRRVVNRERHKLNAEAGMGARQSDLNDGTEETETIFRGGVDYTWQFSDNAEFTQDFVIESGSENTYLESITAVSAKLVGNIAIVASYTVKNNTDVPPLTEKMDTYSALSLEYVF